MDTASPIDSPNFQRIAAALRYLDEHFREQPSLERIAAAAGLSPAHFDRLFHRWAGLTPKRYLQQLTLDAAKLELQQDASVLAAAWAAGLSGASRLHDLFVIAEGATPGEYKAGGAGLTVWHGRAASPFGEVFLAGTPRGLSTLAFVDDDAAATAALADLQRAWPAARFVADDAQAARGVAQVWGSAAKAPLVLDVRGTNFQLQVWRALLAAPGALTYGELATDLGRPKAARAVGGAVGGNPLAFVIPCHRVLRRGAALGGYRWGVDRKRAILTYEYAARLG